MVRVVFSYDEPTRKWDTHVEGAEHSLEAVQAFSAVVLSCQGINPALLHYTGVKMEDDVHKLTIAE